MGMRAPWSRWCGVFTFSLAITHIGSDWLTCASVGACQCKWSSGKKTALCISGGLKNIPKLSSDIQILDLYGNSIIELGQDAFANVGLFNLQRVNLSSTNVRTLHKDSFRELRILIEVDLSHNELTLLPPHIFEGNDRLRLLILNDNPITALLADQFPVLTHLKVLGLARCRISSIHPTAFKNLLNLETVQLHQNLITYLYQNTLSLPKLKALTLSDNPWHCNCRLRDFHSWFVNQNLGSEEVICVEPDNLKQKSWWNLNSDSFYCVPKVTASPSVIRTETGAEITFGCMIQGDPQPSSSWMFGDVVIENESKLNNIFISKQNYKPNDNILNNNSEWLNVTIKNISTNMAGEWTCKAKSTVGEAKTYLTLVLPKARTATARVAPDYSTIFIMAGSMLAMVAIGVIAACFCWKTRKRRVPQSRSFTDQEKKLLDTSLAVSCDRTSADLGSSYGFEMLDRSISLESEDTCVDPVHITIEGSPGSFLPPPAEFALPAPYGNIFISVHVSNRKNEKYPDILGGGATLPRRNRNCVVKPTYDNMGPRITATGSSTWSLPGSNPDKNSEEQEHTCQLSTFSTEFTAL